MADTKISALTAIDALAETDEFPAVDKSDTTSGADGTTKKVTGTQLLDLIKSNASRLDVRNESGSTILKGTPVTTNDWSVGQGRVVILPANAAGSGGTNPSIGLAAADIGNNSNGEIVEFGPLSGLDTSSWSANDKLYLAVGGGLTTTAPTGADNTQIHAIVLRSNISNGVLLVINPGRYAGSPNLIDIPEQSSAPATPASGYARIYADTDGIARVKTDGGVVTSPGRLPTVTVSGTTKTLALTDTDTIQECSNASAQAITIPTNASVAFPLGAMIIFEQHGAGTVTVTGDTGVSVNGSSAGSWAASGQYSAIAIRKIATDGWIATGAGS